MLNPKKQFQFEIQETDSQHCHFKTEWSPPSELDYFNGHFPNNPVLPAVAIIDFSIEMIRRALDLEELALRSIKSCKFMQPITPRLPIEIKIRQLSPNEWEAEWKSLSSSSSLSLLAHLVFAI